MKLKLNEDLFSTNNSIDGDAVGASSLITDLITSTYDLVDTYNSVMITLQENMSDDYTDIVEELSELNVLELTNISRLEEMLEKINPSQEIANTDIGEVINY